LNFKILKGTLSDDVKNRLCERIAERITDVALAYIGEKELYSVEVRVEAEGPNDKGLVMLALEVRIEASPFIKKDLDEISHNAIEEGVVYARELLEKWGFQTSLWRTIEEA